MKTIALWISRYRENENLKSSSCQGRPRFTDERTDRRICSEVRKDRFISAATIKTNLELGHLSDKTIIRRLKEGTGFKKRVLQRNHL